MDEIRRLLASLSIKQRITISAAAIAVIAVIVMASRWTHERDFKPLYRNLSAEDAGVVVAKVHENGSEYRLADSGSTVLVPSAKVDDLRLQLAAAGIPKTGRIGYELFDKTNLGATDFTEQVNFHRALEGELERSIMGLSEVEQARVHLTFPKDSIFVEQREPAKASVLVKLRYGAKLTPQNVIAICNLTASAVEGLLPEAVSVLDMNGNLLNRPRRPPSPDSADPSDAGLEYRQQIERDLLSKINATLEPVLGPDKFRAGLSVDCDFSSGDQSEETFDPAKSVMVTSQKTEDVSTGSTASGVPGAASNLPRPASRPAGGNSGVSRRTESISYQTSRVVRHTRLPQGAIKRLSASVILDYAVRWEGSGKNAKRIVEAPSAEKMKTIHDLVAAAIGFVPDRGDQLVVDTLPFESTEVTVSPADGAPALPPAPKPELPPWMYQYKWVVIGGAAGLFALMVVIAVMRRGGGRARAKVQTAPALPSASDAARSAIDEAAKQMESRLAEQVAMKQKLETEALNALKLSPVSTKKTEVLSKHIAEAAKKDPTMMAHVLRSWLNE